MENYEPIITPYWKVANEEKYIVHKTEKNGSAENIEVFVLIKPMLDEMTAFPDEMPAVDENNTLYLTNEQFLFVKRSFRRLSVCMEMTQPRFLTLSLRSMGKGKTEQTKL